jgi:hypothetical protein
MREPLYYYKLTRKLHQNNLKIKKNGQCAYHHTGMLYLKKLTLRNKTFFEFFTSISRGLSTGPKGEKVVLFGFSNGTKGEFRIFEENWISTTFTPLGPVLSPLEIEVKN